MLQQKAKKKKKTQKKKTIRNFCGSFIMKLPLFSHFYLIFFYRAFLGHIFGVFLFQFFFRVCFFFFLFFFSPSPRFPASQKTQEPIQIIQRLLNMENGSYKLPRIRHDPFSRFLSFLIFFAFYFYFFVFPRNQSLS